HYTMRCPEDMRVDFNVGQALFPLVRHVGKRALAWYAEHGATEILFRFDSPDFLHPIIDRTSARSMLTITDEPN
ncbi:MAG TPA: hypothetical protein VME69_06185, partial [Methylocella sp.]|nr:hypothetical protein [Methylocella sp.]